MVILILCGFAPSPLFALPCENSETPAKSTLPKASLEGFLARADPEVHVDTEYARAEADLQDWKSFLEGAKPYINTNGSQSLPIYINVLSNEELIQWLDWLSNYFDPQDPLSSVFASQASINLLYFRDFDLFFQTWKSKYTTWSSFNNMVILNISCDLEPEAAFQKLKEVDEILKTRPPQDRHYPDHAFQNFGRMLLPKIGFKKTINLLINIPETQTASACVNEIMGIYMRENFEELTEIIGDLDEDLLTQEIMDTFVMKWMEVDPAEALNYIDTHPGSRWDQAYNEYIAQNASEDLIRDYLQQWKEAKPNDQQAIAILAAETLINKYPHEAALWMERVTDFHIHNKLTQKFIESRHTSWSEKADIGLSLPLDSKVRFAVTRTCFKMMNQMTPEQFLRYINDKLDQGQIFRKEEQEEIEYITHRLPQ